MVLSQRAPDWNNTAGLSPLPVTLARQPAKVQMDTARIASDAATLLSQPNKIEGSDLADWPDERKINIPDSWDGQYQPLITYGADSTPVRGLMLFATVGQGTYVYVALGLDEAIARMNPGPYRLLSNLVSLPKYNSRGRRQTPDK